MKKIMKKNQVVIVSLALMIAVAGYLNYSDKIFGEKEQAEETMTELTEADLLDISEEDISESEVEVEGTPGEALLTSSQVSGIVAQAKVRKEQVRAKNKETLQALIDDENISNEQKNEAIDQMVRMTELSEKEVLIETLLASKGFSETVVSLTEDSADVVVKSEDLTDAKRAQIEDIVMRKSGISAVDIVITPINENEEN